MKRKAEKHETKGPVSAFAARRARQQQRQQHTDGTASSTPSGRSSPVVVEERPPKKPRNSSTDDSHVEVKDRSMRTSAVQVARARAGRTTNHTIPENPRRLLSQGLDVSAVQDTLDEKDRDYVGQRSDVREEDEEAEEDVEVGATRTDNESYEGSTTGAVVTPDFPLSKGRLSKTDIVYGDEQAVCLRIREKMNVALLGIYDLWVKRGVVSLMGAKLHPSPRSYRVYAPSTHSLPVIKCVSGVEGSAEVEIRSCHSGLCRLRDLSPLYQRIWNGKPTASDILTFKGTTPVTKRTFSVLSTSSDDSINRHLRPLHLDKTWSSQIKVLTRKGGSLRVLVCGPKASGKSTFSRYLLNHLLSPAPRTEAGPINDDGVAFLDLDTGQPEFSPMSQVYLAHLRSPFFGPPFTHPALDGSQDGRIVRAHHIGATSPKEDPDHYVLAIMDLMSQYRSLLTTHPQCPLVINYPGWIFGLGLEVATHLIRTLSLSDVVYLSDKGPAEVVEPLSHATSDMRIPLTTLPSQPTDFVSRSSAQLRSMQIQSYFHMAHEQHLRNAVWADTPISRARPILVEYSGPRQGIAGVMIMGSQLNPEVVHTVLEGSVVGVVVVESPNAIMGQTNNTDVTSDSPRTDEDADVVAMDTTAVKDNPNPSTSNPVNTSLPISLSPYITRTTREDLPYLFIGSGSCNPLNPAASHSLGLALVRSIDITARKLELVTPIPTSQIREALERGQCIVLVRGQLDSPNWAFSEDYYAARAAEKRYERSVVAKAARKRRQPEGEMDSQGVVEQGPSVEEAAATLAVLKERVRRASKAPWMKVVQDNRARGSGGGGARQEQQQQRQQQPLWKLRKKAYVDSESETDW